MVLWEFQWFLDNNPVRILTSPMSKSLQDSRGGLSVSAGFLHVGIYTECQKERDGTQENRWVRSLPE